MGLILASGSPRRQQLLEECGYRFEVVVPEVEEWPPDQFPFRQLCLENAALKARKVKQSHPDDVILAADTMVGLDGRSLGKPRDIVEAVCMLESLAGRVHEVCTGVSLCCGDEERNFFEVTWVKFREYGEEVIKDYTQRVNVLDKAGAYAIQECGAMLVEEVEGSYENVVGLPVARVTAELDRLEVRRG